MRSTLRKRLRAGLSELGVRLSPAAAVVLLCASGANVPQALAFTCSGRVVNPVTDVCWSCMFPITIGSTLPVSPKGELPDVSTDAGAFCTCGQNINLEAGLNFSYWEPVRTAEVVRHSWCFPSLGGVSVDSGDMLRKDHGRTPRTADTRRRTSFWQVHWYQTPWLFIVEATLDNGCVEAGAWDLAYLSELDPLWDDTLAAFLLSPDASLFTSGAAFGACAVDCMSATAGLPMESLYWCGGCQGSVFPLSGWMAGQVSNVQAWHLMAHRFAMKLSREGVLWSAHGKLGQCGPYIQPLFRKDVWRTQLVHPARTSAKPCCRPLGRTTADWAAGKSFPVEGEDGAVLMWRRRDCCLTKASVNPANRSRRQPAEEIRREEAPPSLSAVENVRRDAPAIRLKPLLSVPAKPLRPECAESAPSGEPHRPLNESELIRERHELTAEPV